jgi:hypothetical protein
VGLPNFVVIGAIKAGTTSLYRYLGEHPDVYMSPVKETLHFAWDPERPLIEGQQDVVKDPDKYRALFDAAGDAKAIGEASPQYLCSEVAPVRIRETVPDARLIAVLRDPVERAFSAYLHLVRDGEETLDFEQALDAEDDRRAAGWDPIWLYRAAGLYADQVERYLSLFDREQLRIYLHEDLEADSVGMVQDVYRFLGVDDRFVPTTDVRFNPSGLLRHPRLFKWATTENPVRRVARAVVPHGRRERMRVAVIHRSLERPTLDPEVRRRLAASFTADIDRLERILGRDLSSWRG